LTYDVDSLRSEIKKEYERVAESLNAKSEVTYDKIREYEIRLNSEILNCSRCKKKDNENEVINL
jgi:hypothetical protein